MGVREGKTLRVAASPLGSGRERPCGGRGRSGVPVAGALADLHRHPRVEVPNRTRVEFDPADGDGFAAAVGGDDRYFVARAGLGVDLADELREDVLPVPDERLALLADDDPTGGSVEPRPPPPPGAPWSPPPRRISR